MDKHPAFIGLEDLNVKGMLKNHKLARSIQEVRLGSFRTILKPMANALNIPVIEILRWYPSSKTCSDCGYIKHDLTLNERIYKCPACGLIIDRDLNAAINIREYARNEISAVIS